MAAASGSRAVWARGPPSSSPCRAPRPPRNPPRRRRRPPPEGRMPASAVAPVPPADLKGYCAPPALAELIRDLYLGERSGVLTIGRSGVEKRLFIDRGMILAASSSLDDERLPAFLALHSLIPKEEAEALKGLEDRQVAEALLKRGQITREGLTSAVRDLAEQIMTGVFRWDELEYQFREQALAPWP